MIRVGVVGAGGRMGTEVCRAVLDAEDMQLAAAVDPRLADTLPATLIGREAPTTAIGVDVETLESADVAVVVDFTVAEAAMEHLPWYAAHGIHSVVGTTGFEPEDMAEVARAYDGAAANVIIAPNFAIGAVLLMLFSRLAAPFMEGVEIIELHHNEKRDAPSGTALHTAQQIARGRGDDRPWPEDPTTQQVLEGARGGLSEDGIRIHSVRLPGLIAHEEVIFGTLGQSLTIRHDSYDRRSFMPGVLLAVRQVMSRPGLTVGLEALLDL